jgi:hypothetical protein
MALILMATGVVALAMIALSPPRPGHDEIGMVRGALRTDEAGAPFRQRQLCSVAHDLMLEMGFGLVPATLTHHDDPSPGGESAAKRRRWFRVGLARRALYILSHAAHLIAFQWSQRATDAPRLMERIIALSRCPP